MLLKFLKIDLPSVDHIFIFQNITKYWMGIDLKTFKVLVFNPYMTGHFHKLNSWAKDLLLFFVPSSPISIVYFFVCYFVP